MESFKQRVRKEASELNNKICGLLLFVNSDDGKFASLPDAERGRLLRQLNAMRLYFDVLDERICKDFK